MNTYGVEVFHRADGKNVTRAVAQNFKLDFLPTADILFDYGRKHKPVIGNQSQLFFVVSNAAARAAESVRRAHDYGITYIFRNFDALFNRVSYVRRNAGLIYFLHRFLEKLAVFGAVYRFEIYADKFNAVFFQKAAFGKLATQSKPSLSAERRQKTVGLFL